MIAEDERCQECYFMTDPPEGVQCWFHPDNCTIVLEIVDDST
jgi:hypothetical protein